MDTLDRERERITVVPDWVPLAIGLVGTVAISVLVMKFMPKDENSGAAPPPVQPPPPQPRRAGAAAQNDSSGSENDDDDNAQNGDGGVKPPRGTKEERRAQRMQEKARLKNEMKARKEDISDSSDNFAGELESARREALVRKKMSAEAEAQELRDEANNIAAWRAAKKGSGDNSSSRGNSSNESSSSENKSGVLDQLRVSLSGGGVLGLAECAASFACSEASLVRRLTFLVEEGDILGIFEGDSPPKRFVAWTRAELAELANHVQEKGRVSFEELSEMASKLQVQDLGDDAE